MPSRFDNKSPDKEKSMTPEDVTDKEELYFEKKTADGRIVLTEDAAYEATAFAYSSPKKWYILTVIAFIQYSMNFNTSVYSNAVEGMSEEWNISQQAARVGQMIFLVAYAFGCELWAPWSEEYGRWPVLQLSLFFVNIWALMCSLAPNFGTMVVGRFLGGLSSAGGSVTLGMVADLWPAETQQYGLNYVVLSSVAGSAIGPIIGGFIQQFAPSPSWRWTFWIQLIWGGAAQVIHFFTVPETRCSILLDKEAKRRRKEGRTSYYGPNEVITNRITVKGVCDIWIRPFRMMVTEPIVLFCSLLSGFSDMLIFIFLESYGPVFQQWGFETYQVGLAFIPIMVAYFLAWAMFLPWIRRDELKRRKDPSSVNPESRLFWLVCTVLLEPIGLFGFAWTSLGPSRSVHWLTHFEFGPMFFAAMIGVANYNIYMATIDYMVLAYGPYSASATGSNGFARDMLAGISAMFSVPFYEYFAEPNTLTYPTTILACIGIFVAIPVFFLYKYGPQVRQSSKFAQVLAAERESTTVKHQIREEKSHIKHTDESWNG